LRKKTEREREREREKGRERERETGRERKRERRGGRTLEERTKRHKIPEFFFYYFLLPFPNILVPSFYLILLLNENELSLCAVVEFDTDNGSL